MALGICIDFSTKANIQLQYLCASCSYLKHATSTNNHTRKVFSVRCPVQASVNISSKYFSGSTYSKISLLACFPIRLFLQTFDIENL